MSVLYNITENGITYSDTQAMYDEVKNVFKVAFPDLDVETPSSPQGQIITAFAEQLSQARDIIALYTGMAFNGGYGVFLDNYMDMFYGIKRQPPTPMIANVEIRGVPGTQVPAFFIAQSGKFKFKKEGGIATIPATGVLNATMVSEAVGDNQVPANTITQINTPVIGVESVTNPTPSSAGNDVESDTNFLIRGRRSIFNRAIVVFGAMVARVQDVRGVTKLGGFENYTTQAIVHKGVEIAAHSISIVVKGGSIEDIGMAMLATKNPGCGVVGDVEFKYELPGTSQEYVMRWFRPVEKPIMVSLVVELTAEADAGYKTIISDNLIELINQLKIGATIYPLQILNDMTLLSGVVIKEFGMQVANLDNTNAPQMVTAPIALGFKEEATLDYENIYINVADMENIAPFESDLDKLEIKINERLEAERVAREQADADLTANITTESETREQADTILTLAVNSNEDKTSENLSKINENTAKITSEASRLDARISAIKTSGGGGGNNHPSHQGGHNT